MYGCRGDRSTTHGFNDRKDKFLKIYIRSRLDLIKTIEWCLILLSLDCGLLILREGGIYLGGVRQILHHKLPKTTDLKSSYFASSINGTRNYDPKILLIIVMSDDTHPAICSTWIKRRFLSNFSLTGHITLRVTKLYGRKHCWHIGQNDKQLSKLQSVQMGNHDTYFL